jgi:hypothetical protein
MEEANVVSNGAHAGSEEKEGEEQHDEVDPVLEGAEDSRLESSLASSNKGLHLDLPTRGAFLMSLAHSENEGISPGREEPVPGRHSVPFSL